MKLTITRSEWIRGSDYSVLRRPASGHDSEGQA